MTKGFSAILYAFKIWLFSVLVSPIILILLSTPAASGDAFNGISKLYWLIVFIGGLCSLPSLILFMGIIYVAISWEVRKFLQKIAIQIFAVLLCSISIILFFKEIGEKEFPIEIIGLYLSTISVGIWFFDYQLPTIEEENKLSC